MLIFKELAKTRQSCRSFSGKYLTEQQLLKCVETARLAPSACNSQPWHFYGTVAADKCGKIAAATQAFGSNKFTSSAGGFIVIAEKPAVLSSRINPTESQKYAQMDIGMVTIHLCFAATEQDLSSCILGRFDEDMLADIIGLKKDHKIRLVLALGYSQNDTLREKVRDKTEDILTIID